MELSIIEEELRVKDQQKTALITLRKRPFSFRDGLDIDLPGFKLQDRTPHTMADQFTNQSFHQADSSLASSIRGFIELPPAMFKAKVMTLLGIGDETQTLQYCNPLSELPQLLDSRTILRNCSQTLNLVHTLKFRIEEALATKIEPQKLFGKERLEVHIELFQMFINFSRSFQKIGDSRQYGRVKQLTNQKQILSKENQFLRERLKHYKVAF